MPFLELNQQGEPVAEYGGLQPNNPAVIELPDSAPAVIQWRNTSNKSVLLEGVKASLSELYTNALSTAMLAGNYQTAAVFSSMKALITDLLAFDNISGAKDVIASIPAPEGLEDTKSEMLAVLDSLL
jgi:hypothetical protein